MSKLKDNTQKKTNLKTLGFSKQVKNVELGLCPFCSDAVKDEDFKDALSRKEFNISGMCQGCQDIFFK
jgi:hypothetical protein